MLISSSPFIPFLPSFFQPFTAALNSSESASRKSPITLSPVSAWVCVWVVWTISTAQRRSSKGVKCENVCECLADRQSQQHGLPTAEGDAEQCGQLWYWQEPYLSSCVPYSQSRPQSGQSICISESTFIKKAHPWTLQKLFYHTDVVSQTAHYPLYGFTMISKRKLVYMVNAIYRM